MCTHKIEYQRNVSIKNRRGYYTTCRTNLRYKAATLVHALLSQQRRDDLLWCDTLAGCSGEIRINIVNRGSYSVLLLKRSVLRNIHNIRKTYRTNALSHHAGLLLHDPVERYLDYRHTNFDVPTHLSVVAFLSADVKSETRKLGTLRPACRTAHE